MTVSNLLIRIGIVLCLFQLPLASAFGMFGYFDEVLALLMAAAFIAKATEKPLTKDAILIIVMLCVVLIVGLLNNLAGDDRPVVAIIQDISAVFKVFVCYLGARWLFESRSDCDELLRWAANLVRLVVLAGIVCLVLAHAGVLNMLSSTSRMGISCFEFIYDSPGMLSQYCVLFVIVLLADMTYPEHKTGKTVFIALTFVLWASTLRTRALVMIVLIVFLILVVFRPQLGQKISGRRVLQRLLSPVILVPCAAIVLFVAADQIELYYGNMNSARSYLLDGGMRIFEDHFPWGTGFATYGTEAAKVYYSPLYSQYGLSSHWALGTNGSELTDTFWPAIAAEFGLVGAIPYVIALGAMLFGIIRRCASTRYTLIAATTFVTYTLIASTATGVFFSYTISDCMFLIGLIIGVAVHAKKPPETRNEV